MKKLTFENETHWRTRDVERIVRIAMKKSDCDMAEERSFNIVFHKPLPRRRKSKTKRFQRRKARRKPNGVPSDSSKAYVNFPIKSGELTREITIFLPKRGSKDPHPVAMVAVAASAAVGPHVKEDDALLPFSDVYYIVNTLAYYFSCETAKHYDDTSLEPEDLVPLRADFEMDSPPAWGDASRLYITKYRDPLKDGTFQKFLKEKETRIKAETTIIERLEKEIKNRQRLLRDARKRRKGHVDSVKAATERRTAKT